MSIPRATAVAAAISLASCATASAPQRNVTQALEGSWGGQHISLNVGTLDAEVEFDCAEGAIFGPYVVAHDGRFSWPGTFTRGTGGPARAGSEPPQVPATYAGVFRGSEMTLTVEAQDGQTIGPFTRCL